MATVAAPATNRKPLKAYRAILYDEPGTLGQVDHVIYFFGDDGTITEYEPTMAPFTCVLGEVGLAETQALMDRLHGGAAWSCTHRAQEVA